jgi:hypothetical protein
VTLDWTAKDFIDLVEDNVDIHFNVWAKKYTK